MAAADKCAGNLWPVLYANEAERTEALLRKLLGPDEQILSDHCGKMVRR
jgi:hypothetical protein